MHNQERPFSNHSLNRSSRVALLALTCIAAAIWLVSRAYQQPSHGWTYDTNGDWPTAVAIRIEHAAHKTGLVLCSFVFAPECGRG